MAQACTRCHFRPLSPTCDSWPFVVTSHFFCVTGNHLQRDYKWHEKKKKNFIGLDLYSVYNTVELEQSKYWLCLSSSISKGLLDAPGDASICPFCFVRLSVFPVTNGRGIASTKLKTIHVGLHCSASRGRIAQEVSLTRYRAIRVCPPPSPLKKTKNKKTTNLLK